MEEIKQILAVNLIGASQLAEQHENNKIGQCPSIPQNSSLTCKNNECQFLGLEQ